jgi:hypothetical protein
LWLGDIFQPITTLWLGTMRCHRHVAGEAGQLHQLASGVASGEPGLIRSTTATNESTRPNS